MNAAKTSEKIFYNAAWKAAACNHREIKKLKEENATWEHVFSKLARSENKLDPETEWNKLEKNGISLIMADEDAFPDFLREIYWPPHGIYIRGGRDVFKNTSIGIVGTRKATEDGIELSRRFGAELAQAGISIVSGLAFGIDAARA